VYGRVVAKTIQIRNVPDDVHRTLRTQAAASGKSLSDFLLDEVTLVAARPTVAEVLRRAADRGGGIPPGVAAQLVREARDR
jgi:plasmid stability protein